MPEWDVLSSVLGIHDNKFITKQTTIFVGLND